MKVDVLTLFPRMFDGVLSEGLLRIAREKGLLEVACHDFREFARDRHRTVDDRPYGGGPGMVLMCEPIFACYESVLEAGQREGRQAPRLIMTTPQGRRLDQPLLEELKQEQWLVVLCGHYEGFDERIRLGLKPLEVSIGDYVLSGGELAAMVILDGVTRLMPGALGAADGAGDDSFSCEGRLLEGPQFTRPREFRGMSVPDVLCSGNHGAIAAWRREQARQRTRDRRPDLWTQTDEQADEQEALRGGTSDTKKQSKRKT